MRAPSSAARSATVALAAMLVGSVGVMSLARAQEAAQGSKAPAMQTAATEPAAPAAPDPVLTPTPTAAEPAASDDSDVPPNSTGPAPSDFKEEPAPEPKPVVAAPDATTRPSEALNAAVFDRLAESKPLLARLPADQRESMKAFYASREYKPAWIADHAFNPAAKSLIARLRAASEDGLDANAYPIPTLKADQTDAATAEADIKLSAAALLYARDAHGGRIASGSFSKLVTPTLELPSAADLMPQLVDAGDSAGTKLQANNPQNAGYIALRERLAKLRGPGVTTATESAAPLNLPVGPVLKVGMSDPRVPQLRAHFGLPENAAGTLDTAPGSKDLYDQSVADAVAAFQRGRGLPGNGNLTRSTLVALATPPHAPTASVGRGSPEQAELIVNMERWRWLPNTLGSDYVLVNIPEYRLRAFRSGVVRDETRVIVGKTDSPTPLFSGLIQYAVVNPSWYVPPSILKTMRGTGGFQVIGHGKNVGLRQPPGPRNALGYIKFLFPNRHSVYLHDTPNRSLFSAAKRAMSHGCVRVDDPFRFADAIMPTEWSAGRMRKLVGHGERTITLPEKLPVHLAYFTAFVDDNGVYRTLPDIYGYDAKMKAVLGLTTTPAAMVNVPVEPKRQMAQPVNYPAGGQSKSKLAGRSPAHGKPKLVGRAPAKAPLRQVSHPIEQPQRTAAPRQAARPPRQYVYGDRGVLTPQPARSQQPSRGWW